MQGVQLRACGLVHVRHTQTRIIVGRKQGGLTVCSCELLVICTSQACCIVALHSTQHCWGRTKRLVQADGNISIYIRHINIYDVLGKGKALK